MSSSSSDLESPSFAALHEALDEVKRDYVEIQDGDVLYERIAGRLKAVYEKPPLAECQQCIRLSSSRNETLSESISMEELRAIMFCPDLSQVRYYPLFVSPPSASASAPGVSEALQRVKAIFLTLLFLLHRKQVWFLCEFVMQDGLHALSALLVDTNIYYRGQAVDTLLTLIDCDSYDWFATPLATTRDMGLHQKLLDLLVPPPQDGATGAEAVCESAFIRNLCSNNSNEMPATGASGAPVTKKASSESWPGGSLKCLQLLGFVFSWCRRIYTKSQVLVLSTPIIQELNAWRRSALAESAEEQVTEVDVAEELDQAERRFAQELYQDFVHTQFGEDQPLSGVDSVDYGKYCVFEVDKAIRPTQVYSSSSGTETGGGSSSSSSSSSSSVPAPVPVPKTANAALEPVSVLDPLPIPDSIAAFKELGNKLFLRAEYDSAMEHYIGGIRLLLCQRGENDGAGAHILGGEDLGLLANFLHNMATVLWKVYKAGNEEGGGAIGSGATGPSMHMDACRRFVSPLKVTPGPSDAQVTVAVAETSHATGVVDARVLLEQCERVCRDILSLTAGGHVKATYRLASVLLKLGRAAEGVAAVDGYLDGTAGYGAAVAAGVALGAGAGAVGVVDDDAADALYTLRAARRQCVSAVMVAQRAVTADDKDAEGASASGGLVSAKVNTVLQALQARREKARVEVGATDCSSSDLSSSGGSTARGQGIEHSDEPAPGVKGSIFKFSSSMEDIDVDDTGFSGSGAVAGPGVDLDLDMRRATVSTDRVLQLSQDSRKNKSDKGRDKDKEKRSKSKGAGVVIPGLESLGGLGKGGKDKGGKGKSKGASELDALMM